MTADLTKPLSLQRRLLLISKHHGNTIQYIRVLYHYRAMRIDPPLRIDPPFYLRRRPGGRESIEFRDANRLYRGRRVINCAKIRPTPCALTSPSISVRFEWRGGQCAWLYSDILMFVWGSTSVVYKLTTLLLFYVLNARCASVIPRIYF